MYVRDYELELSNKLSSEHNEAYRVEQPSLEKRNYAKLPIFRTLAEIYAIVHDNFWSAMKLLVPWVGIFWVLFCGVCIAFFGDLIGFSRFVLSLKTSEERVHLLMFSGLLAGIVGFVFSNIAIKWHRLLLLGEEENSEHPLRLEPQAFKYFVFAALIGIASILLESSNDSLGYALRSGSFLAIAVLFGFLAVTVLLTRLSIKLPAIAVGHHLDMEGLMTRTRGNFWCLLGLIVLYSITISLILGVAKFFAFAAATISAFGLTLSVLIFALAAALAWLLSITMLTVLYRYFFGMPEKPRDI